MNDLIPKDDLKPDNSGNCLPPVRKPSLSVSKAAIPRQYVMICIGIMQPLLMIVGIRSAMKSLESNHLVQQSKGLKGVSFAASAVRVAKPQASKSFATAAPAASHAVASLHGVSVMKPAPGTSSTLQLSGASQSNMLNTSAKQQGLKNHLIYQTARDGKQWFVPVGGNYISSAEARRAISSLPAEVQAGKPWFKPIHQVQQDLERRSRS